MVWSYSRLYGIMSHHTALHDTTVHNLLRSPDSARYNAVHCAIVCNVVLLSKTVTYCDTLCFNRQQAMFCYMAQSCISCYRVSKYAMFVLHYATSYCTMFGSVTYHTMLSSIGFRMAQGSGCVGRVPEPSTSMNNWTICWELNPESKKACTKACTTTGCSA